VRVCVYSCVLHFVPQCLIVLALWHVLLPSHRPLVLALGSSTQMPPAGPLLSATARLPSALLSTPRRAAPPATCATTASPRASCALAPTCRAKTG